MGTIGLQFTETMRGALSTRETQDFEKAAADGAAQGNSLAFTVTIIVDDLDRFLNDRNCEARIIGTVAAPFLSPVPLEVVNGRFNLFNVDETQVNTKRMLYGMALQASDGKSYYLAGAKIIRDDPGLDMWRDTTTLMTKIYVGSDEGGPLLAAGILTIGIADFAHQLTNIKAINATGMEALAAVSRFGAFFAGMLYETYGGIFANPSVFDPGAPPRAKRPLDVSATPEIYKVDAGDGVQMKLTRFQGGTKGPVLCVHGLGVNSKIFSTDLIDRNLVEELVAHNYDVWLLDYRSSIDLPYAAQRYTADDVAMKDYPAAVSFIRRTAGVDNIQCLVHCFGATTFFMAMLAGLQGVRSAAVSQIATHMKVPLSSKLKALVHAPEILDALGVKSLTAYVDKHEGLLGKIIDGLLKLYPVHDGPRDTSVVSRRISFLYGQLYEVAQLNQRTYDNLHELFGVAGIASFEHLEKMALHGYVVNAKGEDTYLHQVQGMPTLKRLAIPIAIAHGEMNKCWLPESTRITFDLLKQANGAALYSRKVIPGYGHIDCIFGKDAARDVFPFFIDHLDATQ